MSTLLSLRNYLAGPRQQKSAGTSAWASLHASLRNALERSAQARARRELLDLADRYDETDPELAKELRSAASGH
jgi:hypothetical protein